MAGLLGQVFSAGNVARRKLTDLLGNPVMSAQQIVGNLNDRARVLNEMTSAAAQEGVNYGPASRQLAGLLAEAYNPIGMVVYHGSPAKFSRFDPTKIGSGEGAQAYGYGHYVAEAPETAKQYKEMLKSKAFSKIVQRDRNVYDVIAPDGTVVSQGTVLGKAHKAKDAYDANVGSVYEIDLPDEQIARMLDWDKPLSKQPENVQAALEKLGYKVDRADVDKYSDALLDALMTDAQTNLPKQPLDMAGEALYRKLGNPEQAAQRLREAGIPGIRYLDQGSRGAGEGTSNFVVFPGNEGLLTIQKRNNEVIAPTSLLDYRGSHTAPGPDFGAPLYDLTGGGQMYPSDVYSPKAAQYYGTGYAKADKEAFDLARRVKGNPDAEVIMYRAVPNNKNITEINAGDWVTLSQDYAKTHGESALQGDYKILKKKVRAKDLWTNADSIHEFGYHPQ